jgi:hypothetical protein
MLFTASLQTCMYFTIMLKLIYDRQSVGQSVLESGAHLDPWSIFHSPWNVLCYFVAPSLMRGRVCNLLYNCFWALPEQSLLGEIPAELTTIFYCLICSRIYIPQEQGDPDIPPGTGFPFCRLLWQGLRWRYSNPPPHGICHYCGKLVKALKSEVILHLHPLQQLELYITDDTAYFYYLLVCIRSSSQRNNYQDGTVTCNQLIGKKNQPHKKHFLYSLWLFQVVSLTLPLPCVIVKSPFLTVHDLYILIW